MSQVKPTDNFNVASQREGMTDARYLVVAPFIEFTTRITHLLGLFSRTSHGNGKNYSRDCSNIYILSAELNSLQMRDTLVGVAVRDKSVLYLYSDVDYETEHGSVSHQAGLRIMSNVLSRQYPDRVSEIDKVFDDIVKKYEFPTVGPFGSFVQDFLYNFRQPDYTY